ncbi:MAG: hypothetical protein NW217_16425 [Hyphomicrobiaceae bacterium]|nr:hypothetical protein [Hyphomicrobiaceae bacterium]
MLSKTIFGTIGEIAVLMARGPARKHFCLADIEWMILPPMLAQLAAAAAQDAAR